MDKYSRRMRPYLGTFVEVGIASQNLDGHEEFFANAFSKFELVHKLLTFHDSESDLSRLNHAEGHEIKLHPISISVLRLSKIMMIKSSNSFNCTVGNHLQQLGVLPIHKDIWGLSSGTADDIQLLGRKARLKRGVKVVLDGIAKGYAVDLAVKQLKKMGVTSGWANAGGDLRAFGDLTLPVYRRENNGEHRLLGGLRNLAMATSKVDGLIDKDFPGKIISDSKALPQFGVWSVTAPSAWLADALTKVACIADTAERAPLIKKLGGHFVEIPEGA